MLLSGSLSPLRVAVAIGIGSRLLVATVALLSAQLFDTGGAGNAAAFDAPSLTHPFSGGTLDDLFAPLARWDSAWYLSVADHGYTGGGELPTELRPAFFPLYPLLVRTLSGFSGSEATMLLVAIALSAAAFTGALYLLHRLVELELGRRYTLPTLALLALFPAAVFFGVPYSESLFLLLSVGAFYAARTEHWAWAGALAAAASATRVTGVVLIVPLAVLYLYGPRGGESRELHEWGPRHPLRPDLAWLLLAPLGLAAYSLYLDGVRGDGLAWIHLQEVWQRSFDGPLSAIWQGIAAAADGLGQFFDKARGHALSEPLRAGWQDLVDFAFLSFAALAVVGSFRRLPPAYGLYCVAALTLPLSSPRDPHPLFSLPRFVAVLFPLFMWLALVTVERRWTGRVLLGSTLLLVLFTQQYATWEFFA